MQDLCGAISLCVLFYAAVIALVCSLVESSFEDQDKPDDNKIDDDDTPQAPV